MVSVEMWTIHCSFIKPVGIVKLASHSSSGVTVYQVSCLGGKASFDTVDTIQLHWIIVQCVQYNKYRLLYFL